MKEETVPSGAKAIRGVAGPGAAAELGVGGATANAEKEKRITVAEGMSDREVRSGIGFAFRSFWWIPVF
jgi:hypothetical protein